MPLKTAEPTMAFFRQYIAPLFIVLIFLVALLAVSVRIFLPTDMAQPAPIETDTAQLENQNFVSFAFVDPQAWG